MELELQDVQRHEVVIGDETYVVTTGKVPNGWDWHCPPFRNTERTFQNREQALEHAKQEIRARSPRGNQAGG